MTTPGGQLTPGDEPEIGDPPIYGVPDGAYVGDVGSPQSFKDLNTLNKDEAKRRMQQPLEGMFGRQANALVIFANSLLGLVQGAVNLVVGVVDAVVGGITSIINSVGSLFGMSRADMAAVDKARADGEKLISQNMSSSLEYLDEIQRVGGSYASWPRWQISYGELNPHPLPLTDGLPLAQGAVWHPPVRAWEPNWDHTTTWVGNDASRGVLATLSGTLELMEPGLWMIYFQSAALQGSGYTSIPVDVWCYVTDEKDIVPVGSPKTGMEGYSRIDGTKYTTDPLVYDSIHTFGRAGQYLGTRDSTQGGGNTVSGYMMCYLDSPNWFVHMACSAYQHFGGEASTFLFAQKVNSSTLRGDIDDKQAEIAAALPGIEVPKTLDEASISAMVAEAQQLETGEVIVPPYEGGV